MSSSINLANSGYYQLNSGNSQSSGTNTGSTGNVTSSLISALSGGTSSSGTSGSDAYLLSLSPAAQAYLNGTGSSSSGTSVAIPSLASFLSSGGGSSGASSAFGGSSDFILSQQQQTAITNILEKFKGQPETQATYDKIQDALSAAGLDANTLSEKDQASSFDPALLLVNDLNGGSASGFSGQATASEEQTKSTNYMQSIVSQWKEMSGTTSTSSASGTSATGTQTAGAVTAVSSGGEA